MHVVWCLYVFTYYRLVRPSQLLFSDIFYWHFIHIVYITVPYQYNPFFQFKQRAVDWFKYIIFSLLRTTIKYDFLLLYNFILFI